MKPYDSDELLQPIEDELEEAEHELTEIKDGINSSGTGNINAFFQYAQITGGLVATSALRERIKELKGIEKYGDARKKTNRVNPLKNPQQSKTGLPIYTNGGIMRHIVINGCIEGECPYFTRTKHYDYNDELRCNHPKLDPYNTKTHMEDWEHQEYNFDENGKRVLITIHADCGEPGLFPKFCPLPKTITGVKR
jgi:hypothetical protein